MLLFYLSLIEGKENQDKFEDIFNKYGQLMKFIASKILQDDLETEDAVQEIYMKIVIGIDKVPEPENARVYVEMIARNTALDMLRKQSKEKVVEVDDIDQIIVHNDDLSRFETEDIVKAIDALPHIYRDVLIFKLQFNFSEKEIAMQLNISYATVRKRFERARKMVAVYLERHGE